MLAPGLLAVTVDATVVATVCNGSVVTIVDPRLTIFFTTISSEPALDVCASVSTHTFAATSGAVSTLLFLLCGLLEVSFGGRLCVQVSQPATAVGVATTVSGACALVGLEEPRRDGFVFAAICPGVSGSWCEVLQCRVALLGSGLD